MYDPSNFKLSKINRWQRLLVYNPFQNSIIGVNPFFPWTVEYDTKTMSEMQNILSLLHP